MYMYIYVYVYIYIFQTVNKKVDLHSHLKSFQHFNRQPIMSLNLNPLN